MLAAARGGRRLPTTESAALGRMGSDVTLSTDRGDLAVYRVVPPAQRGRGIVVLGEAPGLTDEIREVCERLGRAGFVALAPDLSDDNAATVVDAVVKALLNVTATDGARVAVLGFAAGGQRALETAARNPLAGAVVDFYGLDPSARMDWGATAAPLLAIFASEDDAIPRPAVSTLEAELERAGVRSRLMLRDGVAAGFMNPGRADVFDAAAAAESWDTVLAFLRAELG